jgi:hypothetical protein
MKPKMQNEEREGGKLKPKCYIITELTFKKKIPKIVEKNLMTFWWFQTRLCASMRFSGTSQRLSPTKRF